MKILDVNVVLAAYRQDHPDHPVARGWMERLVTGGEQFGVPWSVWWSFLRLAGHPRIFAVPAPVEDCLAFVAAVRAEPGHVPAEPGPRHLTCLREACRQGEASADLLPDAALAAVALEHGAGVVSFDRDFARFEGVDWTRPD